MNKTRRRFDVNLSKKRFYIPEEARWVTLKVTSKALKIINKKEIIQNRDFDKLEQPCET